MNPVLLLNFLDVIVNDAADIRKATSGSAICGFMRCVNVHVADVGRYAKETKKLSILHRIPSVSKNTIPTFF